MLIQPCLERILRGDSVNTPVVRVLNVKKINGNHAEEEYGFVFSDGRTESNPFVFVAAKELNHKLRNNKLTSSTIIRLDCYSRSEIKTVTGATKKRLITIMDFTVLVKSEEKKKTATKVESQTCAKIHESSAKCSQYAASFSSCSTGIPLPIKAIHPHNLSRHLCTIKGRVVNKPDIRFWKNDSHFYYSLLRKNFKNFCIIFVSILSILVKILAALILTHSSRFSYAPGLFSQLHNPLNSVAEIFPPLTYQFSIFIQFVSILIKKKKFRHSKIFIHLYQFYTICIFSIRKKENSEG